MADREKVIKGLECCTSTVKDCGHCPTECPYYWKRVGGDNGIYFDLMKDALSLLKEQEERIKKYELERSWDENPDMMGKW